MSSWYIRPSSHKSLRMLDNKMVQHLFSKSYGTFLDLKRETSNKEVNVREFCRQKRHKQKALCQICIIILGQELHATPKNVRHLHQPTLSGLDTSSSDVLSETMQDTSHYMSLVYYSFRHYDRYIGVSWPCQHCLGMALLSISYHLAVLCTAQTKSTIALFHGLREISMLSS